MELSDWYKQLAGMYGTAFVDAAEYVKASDADGCHMDAGNQRELGKVIAETLKNL